MNASGWWLVNTTAARISTCRNTNSAGTRGRASARRPRARDASSRRNSTVTASELISTATNAFAPNIDSMKSVVQPHLAATIRTGGAAKCVSVPPTETFTNSTPRVAYFRRLETPAAKMRSRSISARSEEHTSELQSPCNLVCRLLLEKKKETDKLSEHYHHRRVIRLSSRKAGPRGCTELHWR